MKVELDIEAGVLQNALLRCQQEKLSLDDVVTSWLKRATRQERTILPVSPGHRPTLIPMIKAKGK